MLSTFHTQPQFQASSKPIHCCAHNRMIADVLTSQGLKTGKIRCLECGAVFNDPAVNSEAHGGR